MSILKNRKTSLASLKAAFGNENEEKQTTFTNNYYPFWNMPAGSKVVLRFLPDLNENNPRGFMVEKVIHQLTINGQAKKIPCLSMYDEPCPICALSQSYYKAKDEINGKKYWKNRQYLAQALVIEDPLPADETTGEKHTGKVRMIALGYQIFKIIKAAFQDDELEGVPYDVENGHDFIIKKTDGKYADYTTGTKFSNRSRPLTDAELESAEAGMVDLATLLPKNPGLVVVEAMLNAERTGVAYEDDSAQYAKKSPSAKKPVLNDDDDELPFVPTKEVDEPVSKPTTKPVVSEAAADENSESVDDMLAKIRARRKLAAAK
jgi:hypothetical protein